MRRSGIIVALLMFSTAPAPAIVGGETVSWWLTRPSVAVWHAERGVCSGVAIGAELVLTAAHCVSGDTAIRIATPRMPWTEVVETAMHPDYLPNKSHADIALLKLGQPLLKDIARLTQRPLSPGKLLFLAGYGIADDGKQDMRLRMTTTLTVKRNTMTLLELADANAAQGGQRSGGCGGDSGGPAFLVGADVPVLVGIVLGGYKCEGTTFITPITHYYRWIVETAEKLGSQVGR